MCLGSLFQLLVQIIRNVLDGHISHGQASRRFLIGFIMVFRGKICQFHPDNWLQKRLLLRANPEVHRRIAEAAELQGSTISRFLLDAALERADRVTEEVTRLRVGRYAFGQMMSALDEPAEPNEKLRRATRQYREAVNDQTCITSVND